MDAARWDRRQHRSLPAGANPYFPREAHETASPGRRKERAVSPRRGVVSFRRPVSFALLRGFYASGSPRDTVVSDYFQRLGRAVSGGAEGRFRSSAAVIQSASRM